MKIRSIFLLAFALLFATHQASAELLSFLEFDVPNLADDRILLDSSGNGNHGVVRQLAGAATTPKLLDAGTGAFGSATDRAVGLAADGDIFFPTVNNGADPGAFQSIVDNQALTVAFWVKAPEADAHQTTFWGWLSPGRSTSLAPWSNNNIYFDSGGCCGADQRLFTAIDAPDGEWHHWAFTRDDFGDKSIYLDGDFLVEGLQQDAEILGPDEGAPQEFVIGSDLTNPMAPTLYAVAEFDEYAIWDEALGEDDISSLFSEGVRSVVTGLPDVPDQFVPDAGATPVTRLVNLDGKLGGASFLNDGEILSWRVEEVFTTSIGDQVLEAVIDLSVAGVLGEGNTGDDNLDVLLGDVALSNPGSGDISRTFRLITEFEDELIGATSSVLETSIVIPGSGTGGEIDPFILLGDISQNGAVDFADFLILSANFGSVKDAASNNTAPEPSSTLMMLAGMVMLGAIRKRR